MVKRAFLVSLVLSALLLLTLLPGHTNAARPAYDNYIAMGDSVASGAGLGADLSLECDRSASAYPSLLAASIGTSVNNVSCSGAKLDEGLYDEQEFDDYEIIPQLDQAYANGNPDLVTITAGANDVRWSSFIRDCYTWNCGSRFDNRRASLYRADLRYELHRTLLTLYWRSNGNPPTVLINGYYDPIGKTTCETTQGVTAQEAAWLSYQVSKLNAAIKSVANKYSFVTFVPVNFNGHGLCSSDPWVQGLQDNAPFHPTAAGQQVIAEANLKVLR